MDRNIVLVGLALCFTLLGVPGQGEIAAKRMAESNRAWAKKAADIIESSSFDQLNFTKLCTLRGSRYFGVRNLNSKCHCVHKIMKLNRSGLFTDAANVYLYFRMFANGDEEKYVLRRSMAYNKIPQSHLDRYNKDGASLFSSLIDQYENKCLP